MVEQNVLLIQQQIEQQQQVKYDNVYELHDIGIVRAKHVQKHEQDGIQ
jgi:hypothetical protein